MNDANPMVETGRAVLRERPGLSEAEFRSVMLERFRAGDQGLQRDRAQMGVTGDPGPASGVFALFMLPWVAFRALGWRGRLARHHADVDEAVALLRGEGHFVSEPRPSGSV